MLYLFLISSVVVRTEVRFSNTENAKYNKKAANSNTNNICQERLEANIRVCIK